MRTSSTLVPNIKLAPRPALVVRTSALVITRFRHKLLGQLALPSRPTLTRFIPTKLGLRSLLLAVLR